MAKTKDTAKESFESFLNGSGVRIVHVGSPDHFIVVTRATPELVFFLDHQGRRLVARTSELRKRWSGYVLDVEKPADAGLLGFDRREPQPGKPRVQFDALFIDKGDVLADSEAKTVRFDYPFRNLGKGDLRFPRVRTSCGCLAVRKPDEAIKPGQTGTITLEYHIDKNKQAFTHSAVVETNDPAFPQIALRAAGNAGVLVSVSPPAVDFGTVPLGIEGRVLLVVRYNGEEGAKIDADTQAPGLSLTVHSDPPPDVARRLWPGSNGQRLDPSVRVVEVKLAADRLGSIKHDVFIHTNVKGFNKVRVPVTGRVVPPVSAAPSLLNFGESAPDDALERTLLLTSALGKPFRVLSVTPDTDGLRWSAEPTSEKGRVRLRFTATGRTAHRLPKSLTLKVERGGERHDVELPVFAAKKPAP